MSRLRRIALTITEKSAGDYMDVGHTGGQDKEPAVMWVWTGGTLLTDPDFGSDNHEANFAAVPSLELTYRGRYDPSRRIVTLLKPENAQGLRPVPATLVRLLEQEWPEAQELRVYS